MEDLFINKLIAEIQDEFNVTEEKAKKRLKESSFYELLEIDKPYVYHYPPSYWVKKLFRTE